MPIKRDANRRWVEMETLVPGTPEQVWQAMATGQGYAAWFVPGTIEPRVGGLFRLDFGEGAVSTGEVTEWSPPHRVGYVERDWQEGAPPVATEVTITSRAGNRCVIRMVHSLFTSSDEWDDQVEGFESGWPGFFAVLRVYLRHFAGAEATSFIAFSPTSGDALSTWGQLSELLGVSGANVGERRDTSNGPEPWSGVVEHVFQDERQRYMLLRLDAPSAGIALFGTSVGKELGGNAGTNVSVCRYFYGSDAVASARDTESRWRTWLRETFEPTEVGAV